MSADLYSVIGNAIRAKLILCLEEKPKNVSQMITICGLSQSAVSQHLTKLKEFGLVTTKKEGKEIYYSLVNTKAAEISRLLLSLEKEIL